MIRPICLLPVFAILLVPVALTSGCIAPGAMQEGQRTKVKQLESDLADCQKAYYLLNDEHTQDMEAMHAQNEELRFEVNRLKALSEEQIQELNQELDQVSTEKLEVRATIEQQLAETQAELAALQERAGKLADDLARENVAGIKRAEERAALETRAAELELENEDLSMQMTELEAEMEALREVQSSAETLQSEKAELDGELEELRAELQTAQVKAAGLAGDPGLTQYLDAVKELVQNLDDADQVQVIHDARGIRIILPSDITFQKGTVLLSDPIKPVLKALGSELKGQSGRIIRIEGHTDDQPIDNMPFADNWGLGVARADQVRRYLIKESGLDADRMEVATRSEFDPLDSHSTSEGRAKNRRIEIVLGRKID